MLYIHTLTTLIFYLSGDDFILHTNTLAHSNFFLQIYIKLTPQFNFCFCRCCYYIDSSSASASCFLYTILQTHLIILIWSIYFHHLYDLFQMQSVYLHGGWTSLPICVRLMRMRLFRNTSAHWTTQTNIACSSLWSSDEHLAITSEE